MPNRSHDASTDAEFPTYLLSEEANNLLVHVADHRQEVEYQLAVAIMASQHLYILGQEQGINLAPEVDLYGKLELGHLFPLYLFVHELQYVGSANGEIR